MTETDFDALPAAWTVWSDEDDGRAVLAYRPDVFDATEFPPPCLPTLYVTHGKRTRRPGTNPTDRTIENDWFVTFYLEPDVSLDGEFRFSTRAEAVDCAIDLARRFDEGKIDYRGMYQVPRDRYFEKLDELTGRDDS